MDDSSNDQIQTAYEFTDTSGCYDCFTLREEVRQLECRLAALESMMYTSKPPPSNTPKPPVRFVNQNLPTTERTGPLTDFKGDQRCDHCQESDPDICIAGSNNSKLWNEKRNSRIGKKFISPRGTACQGCNLSKIACRWKRASEQV